MSNTCEWDLSQIHVSGTSVKYTWVGPQSNTREWDLSQIHVSGTSVKNMLGGASVKYVRGASVKYMHCKLVMIPLREGSTLNFAIFPEKSYEIEKYCPMKGAGGGEDSNLKGHLSTYPS